MRKLHTFIAATAAGATILLIGPAADATTIKDAFLWLMRSNGGSGKSASREAGVTHTVLTRSAVRTSVLGGGSSAASLAGGSGFVIGGLPGGSGGGDGGGSGGGDGGADGGMGGGTDGGMDGGSDGGMGGADDDMGDLAGGPEPRATQPIPEPSAALLFALGAVLVGRRLRSA